MNRQRIPGILAPLLVAAAIVLSWRYQKPGGPVELPAATQPPRSISETRSAYERAAAPEAPGYQRGASVARVTVIELSDFGCPYCGRFAREIYPALHREFVAAGIVRWRYVPFVLGMFPNGAEAARAAECAADQGDDAFWRMHDLLFERQAEWKGSADASVFRGYANRLNLDAVRFTTCWQDGKAGERIAAANRMAEDLGVRATPTFFINGMRVEGAPPIEEFRALINEALLAGAE